MPDDLVVAGRHQRGGQHAVEIIRFRPCLWGERSNGGNGSCASSGTRSRDVERDQHVSVEPAEHVEAAVDAR